LTYMKLDGYTPAAKNGVWDPSVVEDHISEFGREDRWLISRVNSLAEQVTKEMEVCNLHRATRPISTFVLDELSRWYVQLVRPRMWLEEESVSKMQAYDTMYYVLRRLITIFAPFAPHITENMYQNLRCEGDLPSIHMVDWFSGNDNLRDPILEEEMEIVQRFDEAVSNARQNGKRKGRWPVGSIVVSTDSEKVSNAISAMNDMCCDRANARSVTVVPGIWDRLDWTAIPVMKVIGKQFGRDGPKVKAFIEESNGTELKASLLSNGKVMMEKDGFSTELTEEHITFEEKMPENIFSSPIEDGMVYVDVTLTPELESEGYSREVIRRIQEMRKQAGLAVEAKIKAEVIIDDTRVMPLVDKQHDVIESEVRASCLLIRLPDGKPCGCRVKEDAILATDWEIDDLKVHISIAKSE
ncbi:MAG TPA: class I tRNA ligase family protein, partial [Methanocorpusculum sp.]|nr:class I tRNA ligase family protein [Methanocorpusculum sp.]